jgi:TolB-like protein/tetratricopeptide (TPR) repeat protein
MPQRFRFGVYEFDQVTGELLKSGTRLVLQPQVATLLKLLLQSPGELVRRDAIQDALWDRNTNVDFELGVNRCIRQLRAALNDNGSKSLYLETLARRGYRFIAPVSVVDSERGPGKTPSNVPVQPAAQPGAVAVLPFANLSGEAEDEYFADGLAEEIINALTQVPELKVIARTSAFAFKGRNEDIRQIGHTLGAGMILEGSIRRSGKRVRITTQLIRTSDAVHIFSRRYDHELEDVFALQDEISTDVASQLMASIVTLRTGMPSDTAPHFPVHTKRPTESVAAYQALLEARFHFRRFEPAAFEKALQCLERCLRLDPGCAAAYTEIAEQYVGLAIGLRGRSRDLIARAAEMARKAVDLDPKGAPAHAMLGATAAIGEYNWAAAENHFQRARELGYGSDVRIPYALWYLAPLGRLAEAVAQVEAALINDPLLAIAYSAKGGLLFHARHNEQASECCLRALELNPQLSNALSNLVYIRSFQDRLQEAEGYARTLTATLGSSPTSLECMALVQARAGNREGAQKFLREMMELPGAGGTAIGLCAVHAVLGERDMAFSALQQAIDNREPRIVWIRTAPWSDPLRCDERFSTALKQINLA